MRRRRLPWIAGSLGLIALIALTGCGSTSAHRRILDVPFYAQQQDRDCGLTSLRILLTHAGLENLRAALETVEAPQGLMPLEVEGFLRTHGVAYRRVPGDSAALTATIQSGRPVLLLLNLSRGPYRRFHYVVVVGVETEGDGPARAFFIHDGRRPARRVAASWLIDRWTRAYGWAVVIEGWSDKVTE